MPQPGSKRIPLTYAHKKERDVFYEISASALPPVIQHNLHARHKPKVRVTSDQKTGEVLAKIVKCRLADLDVHSPRTCLDWRVSVNLEMNYEGDISELVAVSDNVNSGGIQEKKSIERNKDRMSYRHLAYQIDLTQVANTEVSSHPSFLFLPSSFSLFLSFVPPPTAAIKTRIFLRVFSGDTTNSISR